LTNDSSYATIRHYLQGRTFGMKEVRVRKLDDWIVNWFRSQAKRKGHSLEAELRSALRQAALQRKQEVVAELRADLSALEQKYGTFSDSSVLIREDRDTRG
jgi:plasmid stability protein